MERTRKKQLGVKKKKSNEKKESLLDWRQTAVVKIQCNDFGFSTARFEISAKMVSENDSDLTD